MVNPTTKQFILLGLLLVLAFFSWSFMFIVEEGFDYSIQLFFIMLGLIVFCPIFYLQTRGRNNKILQRLFKTAAVLLIFFIWLSALPMEFFFWIIDGGFESREFIGIMSEFYYFVLLDFLTFNFLISFVLALGVTAIVGMMWRAKFSNSTVVKNI
jgi:hypothetical protein